MKNVILIVIIVAITIIGYKAIINIIKEIKR